VKAVGGTFGCPALVMEAPNDYARLTFASKFAFFCRTPEKLGALPQGVSVTDLRRVRGISLPTDEKGSFINLIKW
jgi:hypothetical protein